MAPRKSTPVPEDKILHPKDANLASTDDWPTFTISHVKVISQHNKELVSLLSANKENPVKVIGWLEEVEDDQLSLGTQLILLLLSQSVDVERIQ